MMQCVKCGMIGVEYEGVCVVGALVCAVVGMFWCVIVRVHM